MRRAVLRAIEHSINNHIRIPGVLTALDCEDSAEVPYWLLASTVKWKVVDGGKVPVI